jgi:hypothetical protein
MSGSKGAFVAPSGCWCPRSANRQKDGRSELAIGGERASTLLYFFSRLKRAARTRILLRSSARLPTILRHRRKRVLGSGGKRRSTYRVRLRTLRCIRAQAPSLPAIGRNRHITSLRHSPDRKAAFDPGRTRQLRVRRERVRPGRSRMAFPARSMRSRPAWRLWRPHRGAVPPIGKRSATAAAMASGLFMIDVPVALRRSKRAQFRARYSRAAARSGRTVSALLAMVVSF